MARVQTVLLVATDSLPRKVTSAGLSMYGYDVLTASGGADAADMLRSNSRISVVVIDADLTGSVTGLSLGQLGRQVNRDIDVIYTSRMPHRVPEAQRVKGAPMLRDPYHPHQLAGVIANLRHRSAETTAA